MIKRNEGEELNSRPRLNNESERASNRLESTPSTLKAKLGGRKDEEELIPD